MDASAEDHVEASASTGENGSPAATYSFTTEQLKSLISEVIKRNKGDNAEEIEEEEDNLE